MTFSLFLPANNLFFFSRPTYCKPIGLAPEGFQRFKGITRDFGKTTKITIVIFPVYEVLGFNIGPDIGHH